MTIRLLLWITILGIITSVTHTALKQSLTADKKEISQITEDECFTQGKDWEFQEEWDRYGTDIGYFACIPED